MINQFCSPFARSEKRAFSCFEFRQQDRQNLLAVRPSGRRYWVHQLHLIERDRSAAMNHPPCERQVLGMIPLLQPCSNRRNYETKIQHLITPPLEIRSCTSHKLHITFPRYHVFNVPMEVMSLLVKWSLKRWLCCVHSLPYPSARNVKICSPPKSNDTMGGPY